MSSFDCISSKRNTDHSKIKGRDAYLSLQVTSQASSFFHIEIFSSLFVRCFRHRLELMRHVYYLYAEELDSDTLVYDSHAIIASKLLPALLAGRSYLRDYFSFYRDDLLLRKLDVITDCQKRITILQATSRTNARNV